MTEAPFPDLEQIATDIHALTQRPLPEDEASCEQETRLLEDTHEKLLAALRDDDA